MYLRNVETLISCRYNTTQRHMPEDLVFSLQAMKTSEFSSNIYQIPTGLIKAGGIFHVPRSSN